MSNNIFDKFDKVYDNEGLKKDIEEAKENGGGNFEEVPVGTYEVKIEKLELVESKSNKPMISCWFKVLAGDCKGRLIFMNQLVDEGFKINIMNEFFKSLDSGEEIYFDSFKQYNDLILDIHEAIDGKLEYLLDYSENNKGYKKFTIKEVYEVE